MKISVRTSTGLYETISTKERLVIGRSKSCDLVVPEDSLSRQHALIELEGDAFYVTDLGSANGVFINGERIPAHGRTPYETFFPLNLASLECLISAETDEPASRASGLGAYRSSEDTSSNTRVITGITKPKLPASPLPAQDANQRKMGLKIPAIIILLAAGFLLLKFWLEDADVKPAPDQAVDIINVPPLFQKVPDRFLTGPEYKELEQLANCEVHAPTCQQMKLDAGKGEGVTVKEGEVFIFTIVQLKQQQKIYSRLLNNPQRDLIIGLHGLLMTDLMVKFQQKEVAQLHLIIMDNKMKHLKVVRLHTKNFAQQGPERSRLLSDINTALTTGNLEPFQKTSQALIQIKDI
jgi:hypothetical protein